MIDRFLLACRGEPVDVTPVWFMRQAGRALPEYRAIREKYGLIEITRLPEVCAQVTLQPVERLGVDAAILFADITLPFEGLGFAFEIREGVGPVVFEPIARAEDVDRMRPFDQLSAASYDDPPWGADRLCSHSCSRRDSVFPRYRSLSTPR